MNSKVVFRYLILILFFGWQPIFGGSSLPPQDLWNPARLSQIRDRTTLDPSITSRITYHDVFFTSNPSADWFDPTAPYQEHNGEAIRIHAYLAVPAFGQGPFPAIILGHGHGGQADRDLATRLAFFGGMVVLAIDAPGAGQSQGGPNDANQSWISVDKGPQYGFLYHYAYAGMRAITLLEHLAALSGNPYQIDSGKIAVAGWSMGGIMTNIINGVDNRVKSAVSIVCVGNWHHSLRYANSWLYHGLYTGTRDVPYNLSDPLNSVEDIDSDPTLIAFFNYFDPLRYAPRQQAPLLLLIGTHDEYFPLPSANLYYQAVTSSGNNPRFQKRLWLLPNTRHEMDFSLDSTELIVGLQQWLKYCFDETAAEPLPTPRIALEQIDSALRFEISFPDTYAASGNPQIHLFVATQIDTSSSDIQDFKVYPAVKENGRWIVSLPAGTIGATGSPYRFDNVLYYATAAPATGVPVSSMVYLSNRPLDLSSVFTPTIRHYPEDSISVPLPPAPPEVGKMVVSSKPVTVGTGYQGLAITNPTTTSTSVRIEARDKSGRMALQEGLINPAFASLAANTQMVFLLEEWLGKSADRLDGSLVLHLARGTSTSLAFRGSLQPANLESNGPLPTPARLLYLPLLRDLSPDLVRELRLIAPVGTDTADLQLSYKSSQGTTLRTESLKLAPGAIRESWLTPKELPETAYIEISSTLPLHAQMEVTGREDTWCIEGLAPSASFSADTAFVQPHVELNGIFTTYLTLINSAQEPMKVTARLRRKSSATASGETASLTIPAGGLVQESIETLFALDASQPGDSGWFQLEPEKQGLVVAALAMDKRTGAAAANALPLLPYNSAVLPTVMRTWSLPFFVEDSTYYTGLAICNPGFFDAQLHMSAYSSQGTLLDSVQISLPSRQSRVMLASQWFSKLPAAATGHVFLMANTPLSPLSYFGTIDGASLAAIPIKTLVP